MLDEKKIIDDYDGRPVVQFDVVSKIAKLREKGYMVRQDGKIVPIVKAKSPDPPWIYVRPHPELNCTLWNEVMFSTFGIFPLKCLDCWKVVVRPRTVKELIMLLELEENFTTGFCKCGIEVRPWVNANYGGYFYNRSKEEGLDCLDEVRALVAKNISTGIDVFLKRFCTEFELKFGPSDQIENTLMRGYFDHPDQGRVKVMPQGEMQIWRSAIDQLFELDPDNEVCECTRPNKTHLRNIAADPYCPHCRGLGIRAIPQPEFVKQHVIRTWYEFAWDRADMTVKEFFGGEPLYTPSVRYVRENVSV